jgi:hypothetical protein
MGRDTAEESVRRDPAHETGERWDCVRGLYVCMPDRYGGFVRVVEAGMERRSVVEGGCN